MHCAYKGKPFIECANKKEEILMRFTYKGGIFMRITYNIDTDTFYTSYRHQKGERIIEGKEYLNNRNHEMLHDFFVSLHSILEEGSTITCGKYYVTITRKKHTGEVLGCTAPYTICLGFADSPYRFIDFFL